MPPDIEIWVRRSRARTTRALVTVAVALTAVLAWSVGPAAAHVTVSPSSLPQGTSDAILTFRVPNESPLASVTGLQLQFPLDHPIVVVSPQSGSGWTVTVKTTQLPKPITTDDGTFTSTVSEIDWSGGSIPAGQFGLFNVLAQGLPKGTNQLVFKAVQDYSDGTVVSWIQIPAPAAPSPTHPAPTLTLTPAGRAGVSAPAATTAGPGTSTGSSSNGDALAVGALIAAGFAVLISVLGVWLGRPRELTAPTIADEEPVDAGRVRG